ncbi:MAG: M23 family metallopeptidase [Firmicutes bacterium]|nr:M23 family metallopeptidase [Bacillota bacterium]
MINITKFVSSGRFLPTATVVVAYIAVNQFVDLPNLWYWSTAIWLVLTILLGLQSWGQIFGNFVVRIKHKFNLPSKENYINKSAYILPFTGKWNVYNGGVTKTLSHSWGQIAQRYAYDFIAFDDNGNVFEGGEYDGTANTKPENYFCHGREIIAAADGVVVAVKDKYPDSRTTGLRGFCDAWDIRGNFVVIRHNEGEYSTSAHLLQGSVVVKIGDVVKQGDVVGKCGNSGNSTEPHLHWHLQNGKNFFLSAGLPVIFSEITAEDSKGYALWHEKLGVKTRTSEGNLEILEDKMYIGRGLDVQNKRDISPYN